MLLPLLRQRAGVEPLLAGRHVRLLRWYPRLGLRPVPQLDLIVERENGSGSCQGLDLCRLAACGADAVRRRSFATRVAACSSSTSGAPPADCRAVRRSSLERPARARARARRHRRQLRSCSMRPTSSSSPVPWARERCLCRRVNGSSTCTACSAQPRRRPRRRCSSGRGCFVSLLTFARPCGTSPKLPTTKPCTGYVTAFDAEPIGRRDRIAFALAGAGGSRVAGTAQVLALYLQATADDPPLRAVAASTAASSGALGGRETSRECLGRPAEDDRPPEHSGSALRTGAESLSVVLRFVPKLLGRVRDVPEAPGVGRDAVVDAVIEARAEPSSAQPTSRTRSPCVRSVA